MIEMGVNYEWAKSRKFKFCNQLFGRPNTGNPTYVRFPVYEPICLMYKTKLVKLLRNFNCLVRDVELVVSRMCLICISVERNSGFESWVYTPIDVEVEQNDL